MDKRVLIISNDALADASSNGRTLKNLLLDIPREDLAQFYIHGTPNPDTCACYYRVSDSDALHAFLHKGNPRAQGSGKGGTGAEEKKLRRSYRNLVLRNMVWQSMQWWTEDFDVFLASFRPGVVLLQAGDAPFMYKIARRVAKKCRAKLMMFNTENYVLKKRMYASRPGENLFWHGILMASLWRQYQKFMDRADFCAYSTEYLEQVHQERYPHPGRSAAFYTGTDMQDCSALTEKSEGFNLVYCGNLGVGRVPVLCTIAEALQKVADQAKLVIYGRFVNEGDRAALCAYKNVDFRGFITYEKIPQALAQASMVIHCENSQRLENLKSAFSTKIADCLACGIPFLVYATRAYPFVQYLEQSQVAHIAEGPEELEKVLQHCMEDTAYKDQYIAKAQRLAVEKHNAEENSRKLAQILKDC